jgi:hypothetical protein
MFQEITSRIWRSISKLDVFIVRKEPRYLVDRSLSVFFGAAAGAEIRLSGQWAKLRCFVPGLLVIGFHLDAVY